MTRLTLFVLRHKLPVVLLWLAVAIAGALTAGTTTQRLTNSFEMPGEAVTTNSRIAAEYGSGRLNPLVPVLTAPPGTRLDQPAAAAVAVRVLAAARVDPRIRVVDYGGRRDPGFLTRDGRPPSLWSSPPRRPRSAPTRSARRSAARWPRPPRRAGAPS